MNYVYGQLSAMIETVVRALGNDLLKEVAFVGCSTTELLVTDEFTKEEVRYSLSLSPQQKKGLHMGQYGMQL